MVPVNEIMIPSATHQVAVQTDELLESNCNDTSQNWISTSQLLVSSKSGSKQFSDFLRLTELGAIFQAWKYSVLNACSIFLR